MLEVCGLRQEHGQGIVRAVNGVERLVAHGMFADGTRRLAHVIGLEG
ncbi:hypothetical protein [Actinomadura miaoliensis]|uniref:Transposase n=1 Tax=Actinomadura miaoliensis TaxID=430685 RepID=A0ABP7V657_9ACTN